MKQLTQNELDILLIKGMLADAEDRLNVSRHTPLDESRYDGEVNALKRVLRVLEPVTTFDFHNMTASVPLVESSAFVDNGRA